MRPDKRENDELREVEIEPEFIVYPEGSVLISTGRTRVLCNASVQEGQPHHLRNTETGWVTAEYSMLPRSAPHRQIREVVKGKRGGRTHEIQRLIGRTFRSVVDLEKLGPRTIWVDCDVLQADGGTRTAAITGGFIALVMSIQHLLRRDRIDGDPVEDYLAAVSVGRVDGELMLDLNYEEDNKAEVDVNFAMASSGEFAEIQASGEEALFSGEEFDRMTDLARKGIEKLITRQKTILEDYRE
ncbi:MAG: ribonuclease PH [bacterium]